MVFILSRLDFQKPEQFIIELTKQKDKIMGLEHFKVWSNYNNSRIITTLIKWKDKKRVYRITL